MNALISVYHKNGIEQIAAELHQAGWTLYSTGGTYKFLRENNIPAIEIAALTQFPEILDGRVKTLHPKVFGPILAKQTPEHLEQLDIIGLQPFSLVIVNFYPFEAAMASERNTDHAYMTEQIDIGGPSMVRAAAKNHQHVTVITDPADYNLIASFLKNDDQSPSLATRQQLAFKAFSYTAYYDHLIASYFQNMVDEPYPLYKTFSGKKQMEMRYGENPHQAAALYFTSPLSPLDMMKVLNGKALSYNNMLDLTAVYDITNSFRVDDHFAVIIKHQNPCGAAQSHDQTQAFCSALAGDPESAYGGIVGFNKPVSEQTAKELSKVFFEVIVAPAFTADALRILKKKKNLRLIEWPPTDPVKQELRQLPGGFLLQDSDLLRDRDEDWEYANGTALTDPEKKTALFGLRLIKYVKSNAIILVRDCTLISVGAGQMSRVDSVEIALRKAAERTAGSILVSDAFFPFADSINLAHAAGIDTILEPGGSIRDEEVIQRARELGVRLILSGVRHFRH
jgi:phosphoribosylaminoimidazolecarboxamide formyltransferase/IMP cyclohydrolase